MSDLDEVGQGHHHAPEATMSAISTSLYPQEGESHDQFMARMEALKKLHDEFRAGPATAGQIEDLAKALDCRLAAIQRLLEEALRSSWSVQRVR